MLYNQVIPLKARVEGTAIQFWWMGKWRTVRYYQCKRIPSDAIVRQALQTFRLNAGLDKEQKINPMWEAIA